MKKNKKLINVAEKKYELFYLKKCAKFPNYLYDLDKNYRNILFFLVRFEIILDSLEDKNKLNGCVMKDPSNKQRLPTVLKKESQKYNLTSAAKNKWIQEYFVEKKKENFGKV